MTEDDIRGTPEEENSFFGRLLRRISQRLDGMDRRLERMDERFDAMDERFDGVDGRLTAVEGRLANIDGRLAHIEGQDLATLRQSIDEHEMGRALRRLAGGFELLFDTAKRDFAAVRRREG